MPDPRRLGPIEFTVKWLREPIEEGSDGDR